MRTLPRSLLLFTACLFAACGDESPSSATDPDPEPEATRQPEALACAPLSDRAVAWYPGDGTAADAIGDADGALDGPASYAAGYVGEAFELGPDGAIVRLAEAPAGRRFTIEGWLRPSARPVGRQAIYGSYQTTLYLRDGRLTWWQDEKAAQGPGEAPAVTPVVCMGESSCDRFVGIAKGGGQSLDSHRPDLRGSGVSQLRRRRARSRGGLRRGVCWSARARHPASASGRGTTSRSGSPG